MKKVTLPYLLLTELLNHDLHFQTLNLFETTLAGYLSLFFSRIYIYNCKLFLYLMIRWGYRSVMWRMLKSTWRCGPTGNHTRSRIPISGCPCIVGWGHDIRPCGVVGRLLPSGCIVIWCCGPRTFTCRQFLASWKQLERISIVIEYRSDVCVQWTCFVLPRVHSLKILLDHKNILLQRLSVQRT